MPLVTRRNFIRTAIAASIAPAFIRGADAKSPALPISFSTLGCPKWTWDTILQNAAKWGYAAIELRGINGQLDLPKCPEFSSERIQGSLRDLRALNLKIADLGASVNLHEPDKVKREKQMDEGRRFIELAHKISSPYIRVFGNKFVKDEPQETTLQRVSSGLRELGDAAKSSGVKVILESHGDFVTSPVLGKIFEAAQHPNVAFLWDAHHTCVSGKESPAETFSKLGKWVVHTHLKDSVPDKKEVKYVLTGEGTVPVRETVQVLKKSGYTGYYGFEWEKLWHPEIADPEVAFPHYAKVMREYLS